MKERKLAQLPKGDNMISSIRVSHYDNISRNLHHPSYRKDFISHYDELFRHNLEIYDLNYPCPPKELIFEDNHLITQYGTGLSTLTQKKSKYMNSKRSREISEQNTYINQLFKKLKKKEGTPFTNPDSIKHIFKNALRKGNIDEETIAYATEDMHIEYIVNQDQKELEINIHL